MQITHLSRTRQYLVDHIVSQEEFVEFRIDGQPSAQTLQTYATDTIAVNVKHLYRRSSTNYYQHACLDTLCSRLCRPEQELPPQ